MRLATLMSALLGPSVLMLLSPAADAGNNHGAVAFLSWDRAGAAATLNAMPGQTFPLYLQLRGLTDVRQLAVFLQWTPRDTTSCGYAVGRPSSSRAPCPTVCWVGSRRSTLAGPSTATGRTTGPSAFPRRRTHEEPSSTSSRGRDATPSRPLPSFFEAS